MKIYLDTNVIRDYLENRNSKSIELVECVRQKNLECYTSTFTMMELSDLQKDTLFFQKTVVANKWDVDKFLRQRRQKELVIEDYKNVESYLGAMTTKLPFIKFANLSEEGWKIAQTIASHSPLTAVDTIHLATAYTANCNVLATGDKQFIECGNEILATSKRKNEMMIMVPTDALKGL